MNILHQLGYLLLVGNVRWLEVRRDRSHRLNGVIVEVFWARGGPP